MRLFRLTVAFGVALAASSACGERKVADDDDGDYGEGGESGEASGGSAGTGGKSGNAGATGKGGKGGIAGANATGGASGDGAGNASGWSGGAGIDGGAGEDASGGTGGDGGTSGAGGGGRSGMGSGGVAGDGAASGAGTSGTAGSAGVNAGGDAGKGGTGGAGAGGVAGIGGGSAGSGGTNTITVSASARGWYSQTGEHTATLNNTLTGVAVLGGGSAYSHQRSYLTFDVPTFTGTVTSVILRIEHENYESTDASETIAMYDVLTAPATLEATTSPSSAGIPTYQDLGMGTTYGSFVLTNATEALGVDLPGTIVDVPLNASAVSAVSAARGIPFSIGFVLVAPAGNRNEFVRFSFQDDVRTHELLITTTPAG
jgi:hypothetical protein